MAKRHVTLLPTAGVDVTKHGSLVCIHTSLVTTIRHDLSFYLLGSERFPRPLGWAARPLRTRIAVWLRWQATLKPRHTLHLGEWGHWDFERPGGQCVDSHD